MKKNTCCLCGNDIDGYGHNPDPISTKDGDRCCDICNMIKVIPQRINVINSYIVSANELNKKSKCKES